MIKVWSIINKESITIKIKRNGVLRARLVACGYSQVPGIDFNESLLRLLMMSVSGLCLLSS